MYKDLDAVYILKSVLSIKLDIIMKIGRTRNNTNLLVMCFSVIGLYCKPALSFFDQGILDKPYCKSGKITYNNWVAEWNSRDVSINYIPSPTESKILIHEKSLKTAEESDDAVVSVNPHSFLKLNYSEGRNLQEVSISIPNYFQVNGKGYRPWPPESFSPYFVRATKTNEGKIEILKAEVFLKFIKGSAVKSYKQSPSFFPLEKMLTTNQDRNIFLENADFPLVVEFVVDGKVLISRELDTKGFRRIYEQAIVKYRKESNRDDCL